MLVQQDAPRIGSLFSGCGGLDMAVAGVFGGETVFVADVCKVNKDGTVGHHDVHRSPCSVLAHRYPDVPNLGDVSLIDWTPWRGLVDILCAGFPCQDVSTAGRRAGLKDGTRTGLWSQVVRAITELQPRMVVLENVPGIFTAPAAGDVEPCTWCVGDRPGGDLRALDAVLADLAALGLDAEWTCLPASGVGAPHRRKRWFLVAHAPGDPWWLELRDHGLAADAERLGRTEGRRDTGFRAAAAGASGLPHERGGGALLPSPRTSDTNGAGSHGDGGLDLRTAVALLQTPLTTLATGVQTLERQVGGRGSSGGPLLPTPQARDHKGHGPADMERHDPNLSAIPLLLPTPTATPYGNNQSASDGAAVRPSLDSLASQRLLPTPRVKNNENRQSEGYGGEGGNFHGLLHNPDRWGDYAPAIARWEHVLGRPAPEPTQTSSKGNPQLSARFVEWLMGLPEGWVTDVPGITRNEALKALGNGVVPQQAVAGLLELVRREVAA